jgi:cyclophilin family peptidyl-prolyl cis-trans isomerase
VQSEADQAADGAVNVASDDASGGPQPAAQEFAVVFGEWKDLLRQLREVTSKYQQAEEAELPGLSSEYHRLIEQGNKMVPRLRGAAMSAYQESPNVDRELSRFLINLIADDIRKDDYEPAAELAGLLVASDSQEKALYDLAGIAAFATGGFESADEYLRKAKAASALTTASQNYISHVADYKRLWQDEQEIRTKEAAADDLPRVKLQTSQGDIDIELFENEAPQTVANFISLVEKGYYDNLAFHRVLPGFMAQGGCPKGDGTGGPGYNIYCECYQENHRKHFRGSLSMAHAGRDTGGSQFFLTFVPTPHLNGKHTVFGRVIDGMDVLSKLQKIDPQNPMGVQPDKINSATVVRKREHAYSPTKVN